MDFWLAAAAGVGIRFLVELERGKPTVRLAKVLAVLAARVPWESGVMRTLAVWWDGAIVGTLQVNQHGEMQFTYAPDWLADSTRPAISFSLPKRTDPFTQRQCRPFFAGLLPEESQRDVAGVRHRHRPGGAVCAAPSRGTR